MRLIQHFVLFHLFIENGNNGIKTRPALFESAIRMTYEVIKTINSRKYRYLQDTYRENGKVKTRNRYIGPVEPTRRKANAVETVIDKGVTTTAKVAGRVIESAAHAVQRGLDSLVGELVSMDRDARQTVKAVVPNPLSILKEAVKKSQPEDETPDASSIGSSQPSGQSGSDGEGKAP